MNQPISSSSTATAATTAPATPHAPSTSDRNDFERAIERAAQRRSRSDDGDDEREPASDTQANAALWRPALAGPGKGDDRGEATPTLAAGAAPVFLSSQPAEPSAPASALGLEQFTAALSRLQAPVSAQGPQQWQFSFAEAGGLVAGVQLHAPAGGPWQMTVQAPARERQVLHAQLDKLRERLRVRGARVGDLRLASPYEDEA